VSETLHTSPEAPDPSEGCAASVMIRLIVFAALGPPLGWLTLFVSLTVYTLWTGGGGNVSLEQLASNIFVMLWFGVILSYFLGLPTALLAGLFVVIGQHMFRSFGILHVVGVTLVVGLVLACYPKLLIWFPEMLRTAPREPISNRGFIERLSELTFNGFIANWAVASGLCLVPTLVCWAIGRPRRRTTTQVASC
jgi:hypothetical protein